MGSTTLLLVGLASLAGGLALTTALVAIGAEERRRVNRQLATVEATRLAGMPVLEPEEVSFVDRVLVPTYARLTKVARLLSPSDAGARLQHRLDLAGNPAGWSADRTFGLKGLALVVGAVFGFLVGHGVLAVVFAVAAGAAGFYLPDVLLYNMALKRQADIQKSMPDTIDLLTICVEAGLGFDAALAHVARNTDGPLAGELNRVLQEMQIGRSRTEAFRSLAERTNVPELRTFVSSMVQADQFGIPVANVLREQSKETRLKRRQRAEEKAQKVPVKIMVPLILFIFPALFVVIIGPGAIRIIGTFSHM